ncbi:MAG: choice-of-anchor D domain-containing protein [Calditrichaeota bacterium]|nr:MAG: choice-of-anchor D domain-containing protein [Calditrichota bacterium]
MKKWIVILFAFAFALSRGDANAQTKPKLIDVQFLQGGLPVQQATFGDVRVELKFDLEMNITIDPSVKYGLNETYGLTLPVKGKWQDNKLWVGTFTVSNNVPSTGDGLYYFKIFGAEASNGAKMDTTLAKNVNGKTLLICRPRLTASTDTLKFGTLFAGSSRLLTLFITNNTIKSCSVLNLKGFTLTPSIPFQVLNFPSFNRVIEGGQKVGLTIRLSSTVRGTYQAKLKIQYNTGFDQEMTVVLQGTVVGPRMALLPPTALNFGRVGVGSSATRTFKVINVKDKNPAYDRNLVISRMFFTDPTAFKATPSAFTVAPGDTQRVLVTFTPKALKSYNNHRLTLQSNDSTQVNRFLILNGDASDTSPPPAVIGLGPTWPGDYEGFTNADSLHLCWTNPNDPSGIAEIWWKFTQSPIPPQSASDTTQKGGRYILKNGQTCASLPLRDILSSGRWYCYVWLVDGRGNSGYGSAVQTVFKYDVTPPGIPVITQRSIPINQWFTSTTPFILTITIPVDPTWGWVDAAEVRWKYKSPPSSPTDFSGKSTLTGVNPGPTNFTIPFNSPELCGQDSVFFWLVDSTGNSSISNATFAPYKFDVCPPKIRRSGENPESIANFGQDYSDTLTITDDVGVDSVWFRYRFGGSKSEQPSRTARSIGNHKYVITIPRAGITRRGIEYLVLARDSLKNQGSGPVETGYCSNDEHWYPVSIRFQGEGDFRVDADGRAVPLVAGEDETNYQLFSIPHDLDSNGIAKVLEDDLGPYDPKMWRLFDYQPQIETDSLRWVEGKKARGFMPGRSYFIITRKENIVIDSGPGHTHRTICPDTLRLYEGWNLIASPFNFPVHKESLSLINSRSTITLRSFERGWDIIDVMDPWKGYALYVKRSEGSGTAPIYLVVQPVAVQGRVSKVSSTDFALQAGEWMVQISAEAGPMHDRENWAGVRYAASPDFDNLELAEPPVIGKFVSVYFAHPEWQQAVSQFSTDLRPVGSDEQVWEFSVKTNLKNQWVNLNFELMGDFPQAAQVYLLDETLQITRNLRETPRYSFRAGENGAERKFKIIAGSTEFTQEQAGDISLVPVKFEVLQNFPNPFNPETTLRYNLAEPAQVSIYIYDPLGRKVRTLLRNASRNAGYYTQIWNGRDDSGNQVASGVYLYKIVAGQHATTRKMILLR